jgi:hypothetical protein
MQPKDYSEFTSASLPSLFQLETISEELLASFAIRINGTLQYFKKQFSPSGSIVGVFFGTTRIFSDLELALEGFMLFGVRKGRPPAIDAEIILFAPNDHRIGLEGDFRGGDRSLLWCAYRLGSWGSFSWESDEVDFRDAVTPRRSQYDKIVRTIINEEECVEPWSIAELEEQIRRAAEQQATE